MTLYVNRYIVPLKNIHQRPDANNQPKQDTLNEWFYPYGFQHIGRKGGADEEHGDYLLEPSPTELLKSILPLYFANLLTQMVLEGKASEQSARMVAMKSATETAKTLIGELTLEYNKARQAQITNELLEITTAMKAME